MVIAVDDEVPMNLIRLFNEPAGIEALKENGVPAEIAENLHLLGISSVANMISAVKFAKYYELSKDDVVLTVATDSMEMYQSRLAELTAEKGEYDAKDAAYSRGMMAATTIDNMQELGYYDRKRIHNLKYYTWIEQQGMAFEDIQAQWYDESYWTGVQKLAPEVDRLINEFNAKTGLLEG
jgi:hypothetical protein